MSNKRKLKGIKYTDKEYISSDNLYGEEYVVDRDGNAQIDSETKKPISKPFMESHGVRIFDALFDASSEPADDETPEEIENELSKNDPNYINNNEITNGNLTEDDVSSFIEKAFENDLVNTSKQMQKEKEEYKQHFDKQQYRILKQEAVVKYITDKFNECSDKDEKIKLYHDVIKETAKLSEMSADVGGEVEKTDMSGILDSMKAYEKYDDNSKKKHVKKL